MAKGGMKHSVAEEIWVVGDECSNGIDVVDANGVMVTVIVNDDDEVTELDRARAKVIAKAPEMAMLLLKMVTYVTHGPKKEDAEKLLREAGVL